MGINISFGTGAKNIIQQGEASTAGAISFAPSALDSHCDHIRSVLRNIDQPGDRVRFLEQYLGVELH